MMAQRVGELERKVGGFSERFDTIDQKFTVIDERFDAIDRKFEAVDRRLEELPTRAELRAFVEEIASQGKTAAEGYGATLEALQRDIRRLSSKVATKDRDRDLVLKDHGKRISALERR